MRTPKEVGVMMKVVRSMMTGRGYGNEFMTNNEMIIAKRKKDDIR